MQNKFSNLILISLLLVPQGLMADSCIMVADVHGVATPTFIDGERLYMIEPAFEDYSFMLFNACDAWGIGIKDGCNIYPMMGAIEWNAVATICDGNKAIIYDRRLSPRIGFEGAQAVIAHELGHHICGHIGAGETGGKAGQANELEADRFAGATMRRLGYDRAKALGYAHILADQPSESHPAREEREAALLSGWDAPDLNAICSID